MAIDINRVTLVGRLTRDAELKYTTTGMALSKFSIAVNRRRKDGEQWVDEVSYFDITLWGRTAENCNQWLVKGKQVGIDGELRQDRWEQDGQKRSRIEIVAQNLQLLGSGSGTGAGGSYQDGGYADSGSNGGGGYQRSGSSGGGGGYQQRGGYERGAPPSAPAGGDFNDDAAFKDDIPF